MFTISRSASLGAIAAITLVASATSPARADSPSIPPDASSQTARMTFHYDATIAAAHGYDVRTDADGYEYAVPAGTPAGIMEGATPRVPTAAVDELVADETVTGDCGTATLTFTSRTHFETSYVIFPQWGFALGHTWNVAVISSIDAASYNLDGAAPLFSQEWKGDRTIDVQALSGQRLSGLAGGTTTTVVGECVAASPTDSIVY